MKRRLLPLATIAAGIAMTMTATASSAQENWPTGYGGFGGEYIQTPSLYYPFPGAIESRFGTYFTTPVVPPIGVESPVEAASLDAANAVREGINPAAKARLDADARAEADDEARALAKGPKAAARRDRRGPRTTLRNPYAPPAPFSRPLPRGNFEDFNNFPAGVPTYSPYARQQTYGQAYGMGPYGSNFYSGWWKGYTPMHVYAAGETPLP